MHVILSGLTEQAVHAWLSHVAGTALQWQPTSLFLAEAELATHDQERQWVWFYRAPWLLTPEHEQDNTALLHRWRAEQRAVLQLRRHLRRGLLLVNADRVSPQALSGHLGLVGAASIMEAPAASPLPAVLAGVFEQLAPEFWELYEALEAASWLPEGGPEFRTNREAASTEALPELLNLLAKGLRLPALESQLAEQARMLTDTRATLEQAERQFAEASVKQGELSAALTAAERQNRQDSEELRQLQGELEKYYLDSHALSLQLAERDKQLATTKAQQEKLDIELAVSRKVATQADEACKKLTTDIQRLQQQLADKNTELQSTSDENELLLAQLHQVQEELENYYVANHEILNKMGQYEQTLHRARRTIGRMASEHAHAQGSTT